MKKPPTPSKRRSGRSLSSATPKPGRPSPAKGLGSSVKSRSIANDSSVSRRTRRFKSGAKALKEIKALQRTTTHLIPKASFCRLVREIMNSFTPEGFRIQSSALEALQEAAEMYMVQFFEDSLLCTLHAKRVTLMVNDCHLMRRLRGPSEVANK